MDRNYLKGRVGDRINAVLAAAGYNFGLLLRWLAELLRAIIRAFAETVPAQKNRLNQRSSAFFTED
jgi:IS5 family transposase